MSGNMPYVVDKGPYFSVLEAKIADPQLRRDALTELRNPAVDLADLCAFESSTLDGPNPPGDGRTYWDRYDHFRWDWLGQDGHSYFWNGWRNGDPRSILRDAMQRAVEVSVGLEHNDPLPAGGGFDRFWPIDFYWICQGPFFQCWVLWRRVSGPNPDLGHVTVLITTPAARGYPLNSQITRPSGGINASKDYASPPETQSWYPPPPPAKRTTLDAGMWVVGHDDYSSQILPSLTATSIGVIPLPGLVWTANNQNVVCVEPAEWEGGVLDAARGYARAPIPPRP
jgi:hypothetical protein